MKKKQKCKESDYYETSPDLFAELNAEFNFDLDACATNKNAKVCAYFSEQDDALIKQWAAHGKRIFCNPPYSKEGRKDQFITKAAEAASQGALVVMVLPAKTNTKAFHKYIWNKRTHSFRPGVEVRFPEGRPVFWLNGAPAPSSGRNEIMFVIFYPQEVA